jgi:hypothetical protein
MTSDLINGLLETGGALITLLSVRQLLRDRCLRGAHWGPTIFFTAWGIWNLVFYPSLGLPLSTAGAGMLVLVNAAYLYLMLRFRTRAIDIEMHISGPLSLEQRDAIIEHCRLLSERSAGAR